MATNLRPWHMQKRIQAREDASVAREKTTLQHVRELEARVSAFDSKEKKVLRVGGWAGSYLFKCMGGETLKMRARC